MELPMVAPAPIVTEHAVVFRDLCDNQCQFRHVQHDLTGLIVLPHKSLAHMARCTLDSADKTNLSRFRSEAPWRVDEVNRRRIHCMLQPTQPHRPRRREALVVLDDTLCEHVGSLFESVDRHDNHGGGTYPLAHHPVTRFSVSGPVRFPLDLRLYRRDEELTQWEAAVAQHGPDLKIPTDKKGRNRLHQQVDPILLQDPECRARHEPCRTTIALAIETFYQDSKGYLGFNEYRMRSAEAIGTHGCLVFVASSLWHLTCLPAVPDRTKGLMHTMGDACRQQGRSLLQRLLMFVHDQLSHGTTVAQVFTQLFAIQQGTVFV